MGSPCGAEGVGLKICPLLSCTRDIESHWLVSLGCDDEPIDQKEHLNFRSMAEPNALQKKDLLFFQLSVM